MWQNADEHQESMPQHQIHTWNFTETGVVPALFKHCSPQSFQVDSFPALGCSPTCVHWSVLSCSQEDALQLPSSLCAVLSSLLWALATSAFPDFHLHIFKLQRLLGSAQGSLSELSPVMVLYAVIWGNSRSHLICLLSSKIGILSCCTVSGLKPVVSCTLFSAAVAYGGKVNTVFAMVGVVISSPQKG